MRKDELLSYTEMIVMETIWDAKRPLTNSEIYELSGKSGWKGAKTINAITKRLVEKGMLKEGDIVKRAKTFAQEYCAFISAEEYLEKQITMNREFHANPNQMIPTLFSAMINSQNIDDSALSEIQSIIDNYRDNNSKGE